VGEVAREKLPIGAELLAAISSVARDPYRYNEFQGNQQSTD
jgi:hypothetical protein